MQNAISSVVAENCASYPDDDREKRDYSCEFRVLTLKSCILKEFFKFWKSLLKIAQLHNFFNLKKHIFINFADIFSWTHTRWKSLLYQEDDFQISADGIESLSGGGGSGLARTRFATQSHFAEWLIFSRVPSFPAREARTRIEALDWRSKRKNKQLHGKIQFMFLSPQQNPLF